MNKIKNSRRSIRIPDYDYSQLGMYFVTICTHESRYLFGNIVDGKMQLSSLGHVVDNAWYRMHECFPEAKINSFVIMPNHIHGIINITEDSARPINSMVRYFKSIVTLWGKRHGDITKIWQRNYYEHVIRDEPDYAYIAEYIETNPIRWLKDDMYKG